MRKGGMDDFLKKDDPNLEELKKKYILDEKAGTGESAYKSTA